MPESASRKQPPGGSRKGIPNKATANAREAISRFVDGNADRLTSWLDEIYERDGPKAAFQCFTDLIEYHVPKLSRSELSGPNGGPIEVSAKEQRDAAVEAALRADR